jgi:predicted metal-dependent phosphoesterase TrpH
MKFDFHCHTHLSDGTQTLRWLAERAVATGVTHLAITDHDHLTPIEGCDDLEVALIPGVEISSEWKNREIHIVGLFVDQANLELNDLVGSQQVSRKHRAEAIAEKLEKFGAPGLCAYLESLPAIALTRSHIANFAVRSGLAKTRQKAFKQYLAKGAKAFVPASWCEVAKAVKSIHSANGIAVLAHPGRYPLNKKQLAELVADFKGAGGDALEVRYPNIDTNTTRQLETLAVEHDLYVSGGSDFHDPEAQWTDIGKFPPIRGEIETRSVTHHPRWQLAK